MTRLNGEGSIYQRTSDGRWVAALTLADGRRKVFYGWTAKEAQDKRNEAKTRIAKGLPPSDSNITMTELFNRWMKDYLRHQVSATTLYNYDSVARLHILEPLGRKKVAALTVGDVDRLISDSIDAGYSPTTVRRIRSLLVQILKYAVQREIVDRNVAAVTKGPRAARPADRTLSEDQVLTLLKAVEGHRFEAAFGLMLLVGLRRGEVLGLRWSDLDLKSTPGTVTVRQALKLSAGRAVLGDVKTASSQRVLPLPAFVADALRAHQEHQASATVRPIGAGPGLVFVSRVGTPCDPSRFYSTFRRVATKALGDPPKNIDGTPGKPWHPHDARHTNTSQLLAQGVPLEVVSKWLGHSSIRITADTYAHLLPGQREQAAASMDNMLAQARAARESSR